MSAAGPYRIRPARAAELARVQGIEVAADATYFSALGIADPHMAPLSLAALEASRAAGTLWVAADAADEPVGFLAARDLDGALYLVELNVLPEHQGRGLGRALMEAALDHARWAFYPAAVLTTDRHIPFNAPFYSRLGFVELRREDLPAGLKAVLDREDAAGLDTSRRVAMAKRL